MTKKESQEKLENQEFDLFEALANLDRKDYTYYSRLSDEQKKKFSPYMLLMYMSMIKGNKDIQRYYLQSVNYHANTYMFNENIQKHPELQWMMLCASSPGVGKQFHQWIPNISPNVSKLKTVAKEKEIYEYFKKIYPNVNDTDLKELSQAFVYEQKRKKYLADNFPNLKLEDIETLNKLITDQDIENYEKEKGN